jgi:aryl-alcohol dehydrogenase-like predicted oxidoreductase
MRNTLPSAILGKTGLKVTRLGYGAMEIRGSRIWNGREVADHQAERILNGVLDNGINFVDTAGCYGRSEEYIGKYTSHRRSEYYLATKCGCSIVRKDDFTDDTPHYYTSENAFQCLHTSLERMKTDYIDVMQLHNPSVEQCEEGGLVEALQKMREQGKVRWISISTTLPYLPTYLEWGVFDTFQIPYSALERNHEDWISKSARAGIGTIIRGGVARGEPSFGQGTENQWAKFEQAKLDELRSSDESRTTFLLRFTLAHPDIHTIIVGTLQPEHLLENIEALKKGPLSSEMYEETKRRLDAIGERPKDG